MNHRREFKGRTELFNPSRPVGQTAKRQDQFAGRGHHRLVKFVSRSQNRLQSPLGCSRLQSGVDKALYFEPFSGRCCLSDHFRVPAGSPEIQIHHLHWRVSLHGNVYSDETRHNWHLNDGMTSPKQPLALLGNPPAFSAPKHVGAPNQGDRQLFLQLINETLDRNWLTNNGPLLQQFEKQIAEHCGVKHCIAMANGTFALQAAIRACKLTGEVIVPSFTFVATAHALTWQEIRPVFCDVDPVTHTLNPAEVERLITPETTGIIGVHLWGHPCDTIGLQEIADRHGLTLMYDAAHAFGCGSAEGLIGKFGRCEVFSFHATKFLQSGEGGAIVTNDDELAEQIRYMRNFGFRRSDDVGSVGINGKMNELSAAMGLTSLASMKEFVATNRRNMQAYRNELETIPGVNLYQTPVDQPSNFQYVVALIDAASPLSRDELVCALHAENVMARRYFYPGVHRLDAYIDQQHATMPVTDSLSDQVLILPTGTQTSVDDIQKIGRLLRGAMAAADDVRHAIREHGLAPDGALIVHDFRGTQR